MYDPPPLSTTWVSVAANPESHGPGWMLCSGSAGVQSESFEVSIWNVTLMPRAAALSARLNTIGTLTHGCDAQMHRPPVFAATAEAGGSAKIVRV